MNRISSFLLLLLFAFVDGRGWPLHEQDFVVHLTDDTFEHETQASTGQTTGSWLIWMHKPKDETPIAGDVPETEFWAENHVVLATLDIRKNPSTKSRFHFNKKLPLFIYIHKGKYYKLMAPSADYYKSPKSKPKPKAPDYVMNWDAISKFVLEEYKESEAFDIPPPRTSMDDVWAILEVARKEFGGDFLKYLTYFIGSILLYALIVKLLDRFYTPPHPKKKAKQS
mmetsp:Transcript_5208/g.6805  ORF Transcript_5208/g.6805 Transcript_5208/m.6805 type:complete len:225 (-) Transcript_5208:332-1006(-)|eukprot:CAMPEP_0198144412 /NCGR_PEP_ID=MMETSP1443-20131203/15521_1 /TAXON_ID=186043 /ORGANISM="Entomoneis sp., Strain CCMP2396" /LENGTH=224 /DNA_ID=CAMNT_0043807799 /DNA_START=130 /DNA_END=804 /DNA_ORIENTATION=-